MNHIPADADVVLCHAGWPSGPAGRRPGEVIVPFQVFLGDPAVTKVVDAIKNGGTIDG